MTARVRGFIPGGEQVLPFPGFLCSRVFAGQGRGHGDRDIGVCVVEAAYSFEVRVQALEELLAVGQAGRPVAVGPGIADGDQRILEVEVLDAQAQGLQEAQAASIEEAGKEIGCAVQVGEDAQAFVMEVGLDVGVLPGAEGMQIAEGDAEDFLVEEQKGRKGLILGRGRDLLIGSEVG